MVSRASQLPFPALLAPSSVDSYLVPLTSSPTLAPLVRKAFIVGPGYTLLVAPAKKRVVEITVILTWIQTFTIKQWIFCCTYPSCWQDTTQYKLLIR